MRKLTFTNSRGESIVMGDSPPVIVTKLEGTGGVDSEIQTQKAPYQDGVTYIDTSLNARQLTIEGAILPTSREQLFDLRRDMARVFNPKLGPGILRYEYDGGRKEIQAVADASPAFPDRRGGIMAQSFLITLLCPDPYWMDTFDTEQVMADFIGGLTFPIVTPTAFTKRGNPMLIINAGDVDTPLLLEFYGPARNPRIVNHTTGEFILIRRDLAEGDILRIDTSFGRKRIEIQRQDGTFENAFYYIDLGSTLFSLVPGENLIEFFADESGAEVKLAVKYRNRYVGV